MAESDSSSASSSSEDQQQNEESGIDELGVRIRSALPYQDEPVAQVAAHTDEDKMDSDDQQLWRPDLRIVFLLILGRFIRSEYNFLFPNMFMCMVYVKQKPLLVNESIAAARN